MSSCAPRRARCAGCAGSIASIAERLSAEWRATLLLAASLTVFIYFTRGALAGWGRLPPPATRRAYLARIVVRPTVLFGAWSVAALTLIGALRDAVPPELAPARAALIAWAGDGLDIQTLGWAMVAGVLIGAVGARLLARRGWDGAFGDTSAVMPRTIGELPWGVAMALSAGVAEELFFRLLVPLLTARATGSAWVGLALAALLFALAHAYQNWRGMLATGIVGALLAAAFLVSNSLLAVIGLHIALDLNALVLRPVLTGRVRLRS